MGTSAMPENELRHLLASICQWVSRRGAGRAWSPHYGAAKPSGRAARGRAVCEISASPGLANRRHKLVLTPDDNKWHDEDRRDVFPSPTRAHTTCPSLKD